MKQSLQDGTYSILMMMIILPYFASSFSSNTIFTVMRGGGNNINNNDGNKFSPNKGTIISWGQYERVLHSKMKMNELKLSASSSSSSEPRRASNDFSDTDQNKAYINGLLQNLSAALDRWIVNGSLNTRTRAYNIMKQIERESIDDEQYNQARRMASRAGMPLDEPVSNHDSDNSQKRKEVAIERKEWERQRSTHLYENEKMKSQPRRGVTIQTGRSALSSRVANNSKPDLFMPSFEKDDITKPSLDPKEFADSKKDLEDSLKKDINGGGNIGSNGSDSNGQKQTPQDAFDVAAAQTSEIIAKAGAGNAFQGQNLGIGGLDDVLSQIKRRIWVPLAAPPLLLQELGISPVRGLLLYGLPGCGKTLLARSLGKILSPARPLTVVSGPEIMDRFVGSSEANLRQIFDNPPPIYDTFRIGTKDNGAAIEKAALHVIILDEFDAMARARGGRGNGDQGDAGVARDSVVNQLLAKMDGVEPLCVPTLVIGMTNKRSLIEPALLRPGRFEVQIEVPKPRTVTQRVSILDVHMNSMFTAGRVLVRDAPEGTAASRRINKNGSEDLPTYNELLDYVAIKCEGFSGASLAGVARAAASRALERAVCDFAGSFDDNTNYSDSDGSSIADCMVTKLDIELAIEDVLESGREGDGGDDKKEKNAESNSITRDIITFVTGNRKKLEEVQRILSIDENVLPFSICNKKIDLPELQGDPHEIAKEKCAMAAKEVNGAVITEDTSLCFSALNELPGPYIKWYLEKCGHDGLNNMIAFSDDKSAYAETVVGFCPGPGQDVIVFDGRTEGIIVPARGLSDFGWDPIFQPYEGGGKTYAEMEKYEKDSISHRSRAFEKLRSYLMEETSLIKNKLS